MTLIELLANLPATGLGDLGFPHHLLGAFRRKSITFCTGVTDEATVVYWFQSRTFTIDLRLPDADTTPVVHRQGWVGDTIWDESTGQLSWRVERSYQPRNQWPEPATFRFIGNSVLEFAPSGAYVEDWRQQSSTGPYLGLRLRGMRNEATGEDMTMEGGLVLAGDHVAFARSRLPAVDAALRDADHLERALAKGAVSEAEIESYEVSVATGGQTITHSTQPSRLGQTIASGAFEIAADGSVLMQQVVDGAPCTLRFDLDLYMPEFSFGTTTTSTPDALEWMQRESDHLAPRAVMTR